MKARQKNSVVHLPGDKEIQLIQSDMITAKQGLVAWVRVGLRLVDVKERLAHGEFTKWVDSNIQQLEIWKKSHLYQAKAVADHLIREHEIEVSDILTTCDDAAHPLWEDVIGKSTRQLSLEVKEAKQLEGTRLENEEAAQVFCEDWWANNASDRDLYEPKVLSGEFSYIDAKNAMIGASTTKGKERPNTDHKKHLRQNFRGAAQHFAHFEKLDSEDQVHVLEAATEFARSCPASIAEVILKNLPKK